MEKAAYRLWEQGWYDDALSNYYAAKQMMFDGIMGYVMPKIKKSVIEAKAYELYESGFSKDARENWMEALYLLQMEQHEAQGTTCPVSFFF